MPIEKKRTMLVDYDQLPDQAESGETYCYQCERAILTIMREITDQDLEIMKERGLAHMDFYWRDRPKHEVTLFVHKTGPKDSWVDKI